MDRMLAVVLVVALTATACSGRADEDAPRQSGLESGFPDEVQLVAEPLRDVYATSGPIEVRIAIQNGSDTEFVFRPILDFGAFLDADVVNGRGEVLPRMMELDPPNAGEVRLASGETYSDTVDIRCSMLVIELGECSQMYDLSEPGTYEVRMRFSAPCDPPHCSEAHQRMEAEAFLLEIRR